MFELLVLFFVISTILLIGISFGMIAYALWLKSQPVGYVPVKEVMDSFYVNQTFFSNSKIIYIQNGDDILQRHKY